MKRLLFLLALVLVPTALFAQADRDLLLTPDGTLYTIESEVNDGSAPAEVNQFLRLTIQRGTEITYSIVPESLSAGMHWRPALAYDPDSRTLFVFWLKMPNGMSSELLLAAYSNGRWQKAVSIDNHAYHLRFNLRIGITRRVAQLQRDGSYSDVAALLVHAVWWEQTGAGEQARYALMVVENGTVPSFELHDLSEFAAPLLDTFNVDPNFNSEILKHPALLDAASHDSIDVLFGDTRTNSFNRVNLRPIADGRIHIPIGHGGGHFGAPKSFSADWSGRVSTISSGHDGSNLILYNATKDSVSYLLYSNGVWSGLKSLPLTDKLTAEGAVSALTRMLNAQ
jgi:hypothetical protein